MNEKIIKKTQDSLGKIIKKPPLTEKLLNKPPFRFLHDIMTSVIKTTGFARGLFQELELNSENVKDKENKMAFLQKAIDLVSLVNSKPLSAKPQKIVAGHEPEKTNEFLQALAEAINRKVDNEEYVQRVLRTDRIDSGKPPTSASRKDREHSSDRRRSDKEHPKRKGSSTQSSAKSDERRHRSRDREDKDTSRTSKENGSAKGSRDSDTSRETNSAKDREKVRGKERDPDKHRNRDRDRDREKERDRSRDKHRDRNRERESHESEKSSKRSDRRHSRDSEAEKRENHQSRDRDESTGERIMKDSNQPELSHNAPEEPDIPVRPPRPGSAKGSRRRQINGRHANSSDEDDEENNNFISSQNTLKREESAKNRSQVDENDIPPQVAAARRLARPSSARPAAPRPKKNETIPNEPVIVGGGGTVPNLIVDKNEDSEEDDLYTAKEEEEPVALPSHDEQVTEAETGEHGGLVKKILETKKELEGGSYHPNQLKKKTEIERSQASDGARRKEREMIQKEIDRLRGSIQTLTRSANPLGKIMDFLQEDLDSMQKELQTWRQENQDNCEKLRKQYSITESSVEPLKAQLTEVEHQASDQLELIAAVKLNILRNDERIEKMLSTINKS